MMCFIHSGAHCNNCIFTGAIKDKNLAQGREYEWLSGFISPVLNHSAIDPV